MTRTVYLGGSPNSKGLVLAPNRAAADALALSPVSLETLARQALPEHSVASGLQSRRLLMLAVREVLGDCDAVGFARYYSPAVRRLLRLDADLDEVAACGGRLKRLAVVTHTFKRLLSARSLIDIAQIFPEAARVTETKQITVTGYPRLDLGELSFLNALAGDGSQLILPYAEDALFTENAEAAELLEAKGWSVLLEPAKRVWHTRAKTEALRFADQEAEVRGVLARVKLLLDDGVAPDDISLVVRDEALYGPLILGVAREYGINVAAYYALPLKNTRVGSFVTAFLTMLEEGYSYEATTRFLVHPLTDRLDSELWARIRAAHPQRLADWGSLGLELPTLPRHATRGDFLSMLASFWDAFELKLPREQSALASLKSSLGSLERGASLAREAFLSELDDALYALSVPIKPGRGVTLHTPLAVFGAKLEHVFVLGLAEGVFPPELRDDPAFDFYERKLLRDRGVPVETAARAAWREQLSFQVLLGSVIHSLTLAHPAQLAHQPVGPSYYFDLLELTPRPPAEHYAVSEQEARQAELPEIDGLGRHGLEVEMSRETAGPFDAFDGVTGVSVDLSDDTFSATQLSHLLSCPFKWFASYVLKAGGPTEFEEDALLSGNLYHKTLELLAERTKDENDPRAAMLERLEEAFIEAEASLGLPDLTAWAAKRREHLGLLRDAVAAPAFLTEGAEVLETERHFSTTWQGFRVRGRIDRLDSTPDGLLITDYKTSRYISQPDVQLLIYEAAARAQYPDQEVSARYYSLKHAEVLGGKILDDLDARLAAAKEALASGSFPPVASQDNCAYCEFDALCRKGPRLKGKTLDADA